MLFEKSYQLNKNIYIYENFLTPEENAYCLNSIKNLSDDMWSEHSFNLFRSNNIENLSVLRDKVISICPDQMVFSFNLCANRLEEGATYGEHVDTNTQVDILEASKAYIDGDPFELKQYPRFGLVYYFNNEFTGGEIYYPTIGISHTPKPGDLVIHSADLLHGVVPVKSGKRYSYTTAFCENLKVKK
jgi:hypothetical protein